MHPLSLALAALGLGLAQAATARADTHTVDFTAAKTWDFASSSATWSPNGYVRVPVTVGGSATNSVGFGDGSDGDFVDGPTQTGMTVSGPTINVNTDVKASYQFTSFLLNAGMTMVVTGSRPLTIRVLGDLTIQGTIAANGADGGSSPAGNGASQAGGTAGPGGSSGGRGAAQTGSTAAAAGLPVAGTARGGGGAGAGQQGGGGGCFGTNGGGDAANDAKAGNAGASANAGSCGATRPANAATFETALLGGAGGGGGGFSATGAGGAGGGGGGALHLIALGDILVTGAVQVTGGNGGHYDSGSGPASCGGGGGGGSGGAIWFQAIGNLGGTGTLSLTPGTGGTSATCAGTNDGGKGGRGILRYDTQSGVIDPGITVTPATVPVANDPGSTTAVSNGQYVMVSRAMSFATGYYGFSPPVETTDSSGLNGCGTNGTVNVVYQGSNDGVSFGAGVPAPQISTLDGSAYVRLVATITATGAHPPCLTGVSFDFNPKTLNSFVLHGSGIACGTTAATSGKARARDSAGDVLLWFAVFAAIWAGKRRIGERPPVSFLA